MRISDWSSDVCSSDLCAPLLAAIESKPPISGATVPDLSRALQVAELRAKATPGRYGHDRNGHVAVIDFDQWGITVAMRSEERRVGKECVRTCRSSGLADH